jgi:hypothetical protein
MPILIRLALVIDIASLWCESCFPSLHKVWPFSLDDESRVALLVLGATVMLELWEIARKLTRREPKTDSGAKS